MQGKTVIITGAAQGIGKAITLRCLKEGAQVVACDKNVEMLDALKRECKTPALSIHRLDVTKAGDVAVHFQEIARKAVPLYGLVNNAGIFLGKKFLDYTPEEIERVLAVNLMGAIHCSQAFARLMLAKELKGAIVNIASVAAQAGSSDAIYGTSKAAVVGFTKSCAMGFAPNLRVNAVAPGLVDTDMLKAIPGWRVEQFRQAELVKGSIMPGDVASAVWFLLSEQSAHVTGAVLDVNNGCYLR